MDVTLVGATFGSVGSTGTVQWGYSGAPSGGTWEITAGHAVPEPSTFALMGLGGIGLAFGAYRRRMAVV